MDQALIDRIYESSFVPELWPSVLDELGRIAEAPGGALFIAKAEVQYRTASSAIRKFTDRFVDEGWFHRGQVLARIFAARQAGFLTEFDLFTENEFEQDPIFRDFLPSEGLGSIVATTIPIPTGEVVSFICCRWLTRGLFERYVVHQLDELRPHLARSALVSARLQLERARVASETLAALGLPALVLNEQGKVVATNSLIDNISDYVSWRAFDRISLKDRAAGQLLRDAIAAIDTASSSVRSFPVRNAETQAMMVAHVVPIRLSARDIFVRCAAALILTPITLPQAPPVELVQSLFDLTPAEARVARGLASGKTVNDIAGDSGTSHNTVRTHVRGVLEKTACNRQAEIVALLTALSPSRLEGKF